MHKTTKNYTKTSGASSLTVNRFFDPQTGKKNRFENKTGTTL